MGNFDQVIDRKGTHSLKVDFAREFGKSEKLLPLWVADMDFCAPAGVIEALTAAAQFGIYGYSDIKEDYIETVSAWFSQNFGWKPEKEWLVVTPGVVFAIKAAIRAFTQAGDAVMIQEPVYYPFRASVEQNGRKAVSSDLKYRDGRYEMDFDDVEQKIVSEKVKLFVLCSPHNPVGRVWTREELSRLDLICRKHGVIVVSDEIHCDFTYPGHPHTVFADLSEEAAQNSVICTAPSKTFNLAGLQTSNIFIPNEKLRKAFLEERGRTGFMEPNIFGLNGCMAAYGKGGQWLSELKDYLIETKDFVASFLQEQIPQIRLVEPEGTYLLWLDASGLGLTDERLKRFFEDEAGLWLDEGDLFCKSCGQFTRLNIASPRSIVAQAMEQLAAAVRKGME